MDYINDTVWFYKKSTSLNALGKGACRQRVIERCPSLSIATERLDRRMNSLIEAYQGMFAGTRIATVGVRDGNGRPRMPQVARPGRRGAACPRDGRESQAGARGLQPWYMELSKERPGRRL